MTERIDEFSFVFNAVSLESCGSRRASYPDRSNIVPGRAINLRVNRAAFQGGTSVLLMQAGHNGALPVFLWRRRGRLPACRYCLCAPDRCAFFSQRAARSLPRSPPAFAGGRGPWKRRGHILKTPASARTLAAAGCPAAVERRGFYSPAHSFSDCTPCLLFHRAARRAQHRLRFSTNRRARPYLPIRNRRRARLPVRAARRSFPAALLTPCQGRLRQYLYSPILPGQFLFWSLPYRSAHPRIPVEQIYKQEYT